MIGDGETTSAYFHFLCLTQYNISNKKTCRDCHYDDLYFCNIKFTKCKINLTFHIRTNIIDVKSTLLKLKGA